MITLTEEQKQALKETPIANARLYVDKKVATEKLLSSICNFGFGSLFDLYSVDFNQLSKTEYKSFPRGKTLVLQKLFREMPPQVFDDIVFWNKKYVFPTNYDPAKSLFENVDLIFGELLAYVNGCEQRVEQIENDSDKKRVQARAYILESHYREGLDLIDVEKELRKLGLIKGSKNISKKDRDSRTRQILKEKFLTPLFLGEGDIAFPNISIHDEIVKRRADELFTILPTPPSLFVQHALNVDYVELRNGLGYIIVPAGTKGVYERLQVSFFDEMTAIIQPMRKETILDIISKNEKVVYKDILSEGKLYDDNFIYALLSFDDLTEVRENGVLLRYKHIISANGSIHKERALARIIADADRPLTKMDVGAEYIRRYGCGDVSPNLTTTKYYGCKAVGNYWIYGEKKLPKPQAWVEDYAKEKEIFYFDNILADITAAGYTFAEIAPKTLRTYITNCSRVDKKDKNHFCYKECIEKYVDYDWTTPSRSGILHWLATEIKALFVKEQKDKISIKEVNRWLYKHGKGTEYEEEKEYGYTVLISHSTLTDEGGPFIVESVERGEWYLKKNDKVYNSIDWSTFGKRGGLFDKKLVAEAANIIRRSEDWEMPLWDLAKEIYEAEYVEGLSHQQIRKKLERVINSTDIHHALKLKPSKKERKKWVVTIDAHKIVNIAQYDPTSTDVKIEYKTISQISALDWDALRPVLYNELMFCSDWLRDNGLCSYADAFERFEKIVRGSDNKNLSKIFAQRLYEFFFVSDPTEDDQYCIMCSIAKNFEALIQDIYWRNTGVKQKKNGLFDLTEKCEFYAFNDVLDEKTKIWNMPKDSYENALKYLSFVRNADAHGEWYIDTYKGDSRPEADKNVDKIKKFAALYIFAVAKYLN